MALGGEKSLLLVVVKDVRVAVFGEVTVTLRMENSPLHQVGYGGARFVSWIKLYQGVRPQFSAFEFLVNKFLYTYVTNF